MKASAFIATSLDGYIAREDGDLDWLEFEATDPVDGDHAYQPFFDSVDGLVMGRNSFEKVLTFAGGWPYADKPVIVLTSRPIDIPDDLAATVESFNLPPVDVCDELASRGMKHLYIDGGNTIQRFLTAGLIQRITITFIPILLGSGIRLFGPLQSDIELTLIESAAFSSGLVQSTYELE